MKKIKILFKISITIVALYLLIDFNIVSFDDIAALNGKYRELSLVLALMIITLFIASYKWWIILKKSEYNVPYKMSFCLYTTGLFFNSIMPGSAGGDIVKGFYLFKFVKSSQRTKALSTIIVDRVIGLHALLIITLYSLASLWVKINKYEEILFIFFMILFLIIFIPLLIYISLFFSSGILSFLNKFDNKLLNNFSMIMTKLYNAFYTYNENFSTLIFCYILSIINHIILIYCFYIIGIILLESDLHILDIYVSSSLSLVINIIPITPGGIGIGESAFDYILSRLITFDENLAYGSIFFITYRVLFTIASFVGAYSFIILKKPESLFKRK